jgi:hypothetical protein
MYTIRKTRAVFTVSPATQSIGVGGVVWWANADSTDSLDIIFDDSTVATPDPLTRFNTGGGNIPPFQGGTFNLFFNPGAFTRSRRFLRAGNFHWYSTRAGVSGTVVVR